MKAIYLLINTNVNSPSTCLHSSTWRYQWIHFKLNVSSLAICIQVNNLTVINVILWWVLSNLQLTEGLECYKLYFDFQENIRSILEAVVQKCSVNKMLLELSQNSQENACTIVCLLIKFQAETWKFNKEETLTQVFSCFTFSKFLRTPFLWLLLTFH